MFKILNQTELNFAAERTYHCRFDGCESLASLEKKADLDVNDVPISALQYRTCFFGAKKEWRIRLLRLKDMDFTQVETYFNNWQFPRMTANQVFASIKPILDLKDNYLSFTNFSILDAKNELWLPTLRINHAGRRLFLSPAKKLDGNALFPTIQEVPYGTEWSEHHKEYKNTDLSPAEKFRRYITK